MSTTFSSRSVLREGLALTLNNPGASVALAVIYVVFIGALDIVPMFLSLGMLSSLLVQVFSYAAQAWVAAGLSLLVLHALRSGGVRLGYLIQGIPFLLRVLVIQIVMQVLAFLSVLPGLVACVVVYQLMGPGIAALKSMPTDVFGILEFINQYSVFLIVELVIIGIAIIPPFLVGTYLGFSIYLVVDKGAGIVDAMSGSIQLVRGSLLRLINFSVLIALINLAGALCFLAGLLLTGPLTLFAHGAVYRNLLRRMESDSGHPYLRAGILSETYGETKS